MTPTEQTTVQALLIALAQLETSLPDDLQQDIHQIGNDLKQQSNVAITKIPQLVEKHSQLKNLYRAARSNLQKQYQNQQRDKFKFEISASGTPALKPITIETIAIDLLTADDFQATAQQIIKQVKDSKDSFINAFQTAVSVTQAKENLKAFSILKALEFRPLTIENLAYALEMSPEQTRKIIQRLWQEGKINTTNGSILGTILPFLRPKKQPSQINDAKTYFTLTSWGYFYLHPVIKVS